MCAIHELRQMKIQLLSNVCVKDQNFKCISPQIELEWCGILCSGKYGSLVNSCQQLQKESEATTEGVCFREFCCNYH